MWCDVVITFLGYRFRGIYISTVCIYWVRKMHIRRFVGLTDVYWWLIKIIQGVRLGGSVHIHVINIFIATNFNIFFQTGELTRSTRRAQTSLTEADHYSHISQCNNVEPWWWKTNSKAFGSLPAPRSGYVTTIMVFVCSFTHLRIRRSPPTFNQFFSVLPRTPP